jgi:hypothetical protein
MKPALVLPTAALPRTNRWMPVVLTALLALPAAAGAQCPVGATGTDQASMVLRLKKGETHRVLSTSDQTTTQTVMGQQQTMHEVTKMGIRFDVLGQGENGQHRIRITYESVSVDATTPMSSFSWSSADTTKPVPQGAEMFAALVGHGYTVAMDPDGSNRHVEGWDSVSAQLMDVLPLPPGSSADQMKEMLKNNVGENIFGAALKGAVVVMPSKAAAVGDSWSCTSHTGGSLGLSSTSTWTVDSRSGGVTAMKVASQMKSDSAASMSMGAMTVHYALEGTSTSTAQIQDATGWILRLRSESDVTGTATVEGSPMGPMEIPMSVKSTTTTEPMSGG